MATKAWRVIAVFLILCVMAMLVAFAGPAFAGSVQASDDDFTPSDWTISLFTIGNGASVSASQQAAGGNPGPYRSIRNVVASSPAIAPFFSAILGAHIFGGFTYDPSATGAITSIDYSEDAICILPNCFGDGQAVGVIVRQNGNTYLHGLGITTSSTSWHTISDAGLGALDFVLLDGSDDFVDGTSHPDFSVNGDPIEVGFARYNSTCVSCGGYTLDAGIDNWRVVINFEDLNTDTPSDDGPSDTPRVPAPGALLLLAIGVTTLGALRRLR